MAVASESQQEHDRRIPPALLKLMIAVALGAIMIQMDATMTNIAFNTWLKEFDTTLVTIQWVATGYLLAMAAVMAPSGWALERFGARTTWLACLSMFILGSVLCGMAWSVESLIVFRVIQGLGGGMIMPLGMAILAQEAGPSRLGRVMSVMGIPTALGPVLGPVVGGWIVSDADWRWIFYINVPICLVAIVLAWRVMPTRRAAASSRLDIVGLLLLSPACAVVVYGLAEAGKRGTFADAHSIVPLVIGVALLGVFAFHALRAENPILDLRMMKIRSFTSSTSVLFFASVALFGAMGVLPLYYQQVRGHTPMETGLQLIPLGAGMALSMTAAGWLADRLSPRLLVIGGLALTAVGSAVYTQLNAGSNEAMLGVALVFSGAGMGGVMVPAMASAVRDVPPMAIPRASATNRIIMQVGSSFGAAVLLIVAQSRITQLAESGRVTPDGLAGAYGRTFWWALGFAAFAALLALLMPSQVAGRKKPKEGAAAAPTAPGAASA
ncbi:MULTISPECIES: DHA2 family efflux MFS transporter permease subunit [unclassified Streptomyces]|uniref:DHA2 family efflux MFS transporter permease subunit n=1 Tax=unclassified Streptomyces TaxID=2593676 RepID=UPI002DDBC141|nr:MULTISPECIES: DHA2 family efflux MFS transporter permease subunit [unclassified Streptomyces]WSA95909.1 DHA2 family efflux MFS transporter permease subunit [Streptomyces sp. NBC_01795]WSS11465.1 DHA2 family efflux MFS transporter permease subunit [Streptomyces sp. NBC_01186]WSS40179.1 DHA2 family efflux MFS transporter permease subunit [Streptomyces sp. NBC_01187]